MKSSLTFTAKLATWQRWDAVQILRLPAYRHLLLGNILNQMGREARMMAQAWLILALTNSDAWVGAVVGLPAITAAVMALISGVLADRFNRRTMLIIIQLVLTGVALLTMLLVAADLIHIWHLLALAFIISLVDVSGMTASQTLIMDQAPRVQLFSANAVYTATNNLAIVVSPALTGLIIAHFGVTHAFGFSVLLFAGALWAITNLRIATPIPERTDTSIRHDFQEGVHYVRQTPVLRWLMVIGLTVIAVGVWPVVVPRYARDVLNAGATGYGAILSARGVGGLVGMITLISAGNVKRLGRVLLGCALAFALLAILFVQTTVLWTAVATSFGLGIIFIWWPATLRTAVQLSATDAMRGRAMGLFSLMMQILTFGWLVGGLLSDAIGSQLAMMAMAALCAAGNLLVYMRSAEVRAIGQDGVV
ncbi:MAG: MFS transporter [Caldilineaceae bacterium]